MTCENCPDYKECYINKCYCPCHSTKPEVFMENYAEQLIENIIFNGVTSFQETNIRGHNKNGKFKI